MNFTQKLNSRLKNITLDWEKAPDPYMPNKSCVLHAYTTNDKSNKVTFRFDNGLDESMEDFEIDSIAQSIISSLSK